jgi:hypothetical protein
MFKTLKQLFCSHDVLLTKRVPIPDSDLYHMYTECFDCGYESPGVDVGGNKPMNAVTV